MPQWYKNRAFRFTNKKHISRGVNHFKFQIFVLLKCQSQMQYVKCACECNFVPIGEYKSVFSETDNFRF